jgi:hypothetical protein
MGMAGGQRSVRKQAKEVGMRQRQLWATLLVLTALLHWGCGGGMPSMSGTDLLTKLLTNQLGVTSNQATGGVGSILSLAKERLPSMDFTTLTKLIPGADTYMQSARDLGAVTGPVGDRAGLTSAFSRLGMGSDKVPKFSQILSDFVGKAGGQPASNLVMQAVQ